MADDWFWHPDRLPQARALVPYNPMPALPSDTTTLPQLNLADLDAGFQLAARALEVLLAASGTPASIALYDPRLEVIRAYFIACSRGEIGLPLLLAAAQAELLGMRDAPIAAILGFELAKVGFLSMGRPGLAAPFGREAARGRLWLQASLLAQRTQLQENSDATTFHWEE